MNDPRLPHACTQCGARLPARFGLVRCEYCGAEMRFEAPQVRQGYGPAAPAPPPPPVAGKRFAGGVAWLVFAAMGIGMSIYASRMASRAAQTQSTFGASGAPSELGEVVAQTVEAFSPPVDPPKWRSHVCFLRDLDGDGVTELGGAIELASVPEKLIPVRVDGATGEIEWRGEPFSRNDTKVLCLSDALLGISDEAALALDVYALDGDAHFRRSLSDKLEHYGLGDACISLRTADRTTIGLSLAGGSEAPCAAKPTQRTWGDAPSVDCSIISTIDSPRKANEGGRNFELRPRNPGTPFLVVRALEDRKELWKQTLRFIPAGGEAIGCIALTAAQGSVVTIGASRENDDELWLVGLDASTGIERYARRQGTRPASNLVGFGYNQRFVIMGESWNDELVAFDPVTGEEAWRIGGR